MELGRRGDSHVVTWVLYSHSTKQICSDSSGFHLTKSSIAIKQTLENLQFGSTQDLTLRKLIPAVEPLAQGPREDQRPIHQVSPTPQGLLPPRKSQVTKRTMPVLRRVPGLAWYSDVESLTYLKICPVSSDGELRGSAPFKRLKSEEIQILSFTSIKPSKGFPLYIPIRMLSVRTF